LRTGSPQRAGSTADARRGTRIVDPGRPSTLPAPHFAAPLSLDNATLKLMVRLGAMLAAGIAMLGAIIRLA